MCELRPRSSWRNSAGLLTRCPEGRGAFGSAAPPAGVLAGLLARRCRGSAGVSGDWRTADASRTRGDQCTVRLPPSWLCVYPCAQYYEMPRKHRAGSRSKSVTQRGGIGTKCPTAAPRRGARRATASRPGCRAAAAPSHGRPRACRRARREASPCAQHTAPRRGAPGKPDLSVATRQRPLPGWPRACPARAARSVAVHASAQCPAEGHRV